MMKNKFTISFVSAFIIINIIFIIIAIRISNKPANERQIETSADITTAEQITDVESETINVEETTAEETTTIAEDTHDYEQEVAYNYTLLEIVQLAQVIQVEGNGLNLYEKSLIVWSVLNRVDSNSYPDTIYNVISFGHDYGKDYAYAWWENAVVTEENLFVAEDVLKRWCREKAGDENVGRTLPSNITQFRGGKKYRTEYFLNMIAKYSKYGGCSSSSKHNWYFESSETGKDINKRKYYDFSLPNPY